MTSGMASASRNGSDSQMWRAASMAPIVKSAKMSFKVKPLGCEQTRHYALISQFSQRGAV